MGSPGKSGRKQRKEVSSKPMKRRISNRQGNKTILSSFFLLFPRRAQTSLYNTTKRKSTAFFSLANRKGPAQNVCTTAQTPQSKQRIHMERLFSVKRRTARIKKLREKSPRCGLPGGCFARPSRRDKRGKILATWLANPSDTQAAQSTSSSPYARTK